MIDIFKILIYQSNIINWCQNKEIFYEGNHTWTTEYQNRKVYNTQEEATTELYEFGGEVVSD